MWLTKAETWALADGSAAAPWSTWSSRKPTPAIGASAARATIGDMAAAVCPACQLRAKGFAAWQASCSEGQRQRS